MNPYLRWLLHLIGPLLLVYFLWTSDLHAIIAIFGQLSLMPLVLSLILYPVFVIVKSWRWSLLMRELGLDAPPLGKLMVLYMIGLFLGGTTPGQSGDLVKAGYLRERGQPLAPALFSIILDRLFDFAIMALLALLGLGAFINVFPSSVRIATIIVAMLFIVTTPSLMARGPREWLMTRMLPLLPSRIRAAIERWRDQFTSLTLRPALLAQLLLASAGSAFTTMFRIYLLFLALKLQVPILAIIASTALISILQALPISFSGLGVREAVLVPVLGLYGYSQESALSLSALFLLLNIEHILLGFLVSLRYPISVATTAPDTVPLVEPTEQVQR